MARKKRREPAHAGGIVKWLIAIGLIAMGLILFFASISYTPFEDPSINFAGILGASIFGGILTLFGAGAYLVPLLIFAAGVFVILERVPVALRTSIGSGVIALSILALLGLISEPAGGMFGVFLGHLARDLFGLIGAIVILIALAGIGLVMATDIVALTRTLRDMFGNAKDRIGTIELPSLPKKENGDAHTAEEAAQPVKEVQEPDREPVVKLFSDNAGPAGTGIANFDAEYQAPPLSILGEDKGKPGVGDIKANANIIKRTFQNFGISVEMDEVSIGPTVTRYAMKPAEGVRLSKIIGLQNNLELALAAHPVRIEAPIPGKSLVGIEVPNASKAMVGLGGVLSSPDWSKNDKPLLAAVGRDITGTPHYVNVAKMPHGLIAGATGSGKSVAIHALITSLLYRNGPNQLRFIMIDPKRVELTLYNGIPHLLTPVITDPKKAIMSLKWAAKEMDRRYNILEAEAVRDIDSYHKTVVEPAKKRKSGDMPEPMPYIIIVVDELADIMQTYPRELEAGIVRLAQMSRAVGIHLMLSTQRPSVNVITGLIKANVPTRMALQVASQIDSRTILDQGGAETLLGAGDMLYMSADMQKPIRLQTAYIAETEVKKVASYIKQNNAGALGSLDLGAANGNNAGGTDVNDAIMLSDAEGDVDDDLYTEAKAAVEEAGRASTSYLQRKLRIGYSRAARLMDILEEKGVIGAADGSRPRDVLSKAGSPPPPANEEVF